MTSRLRQLLAEATPAPWKNTDGDIHAVADDGQYGQELHDDFFHNEADAALIVYLRNHADTLADLIDAAEELKLWEPGRAGYAAAQNAVFAVLARLEEKK